MGKIGAGVCFWLEPLGGGMEHMFKLNSRRRNVNMNKTGGAAAAGVVLCETSPCSMDARRSLCRFDGRSKLLVRSLLSGASGAHRALSVFRKQQRANPETSLCNFIETLCQDEITCPDTEAQPLTV